MGYASKASMVSWPEATRSYSAFSLTCFEAEGDVDSSVNLLLIWRDT